MQLGGRVLRVRIAVGAWRRQVARRWRRPLAGALLHPGRSLTPPGRHDLRTGRLIPQRPSAHSRAERPDDRGAAGNPQVHLHGPSGGTGGAGAVAALGRRQVRAARSGDPLRTGHGGDAAGRQRGRPTAAG